MDYVCFAILHSKCQGCFIDLLWSKLLDWIAEKYFKWRHIPVNQSLFKRSSGLISSVRFCLKMLSIIKPGQSRKDPWGFIFPSTRTSRGFTGSFLAPGHRMPTHSPSSTSHLCLTSFLCFQHCRSFSWGHNTMNACDSSLSLWPFPLHSLHSC